MKFPSSIVLLTQLISLRVALANPFASPQDDESDLHCDPKSCDTFNTAINKCAETNNFNISNIETNTPEAGKAYQACYCDLSELFEECNACFGNRTEAAEQREMRAELCNITQETNTTTGNVNNTSTGGDSDDDGDDKSNEPETDTKKNNAGVLYLGKSMIAGLMIVAGGVIVAM